MKNTGSHLSTSVDEWFKVVDCAISCSEGEPPGLETDLDGGPTLRRCMRDVGDHTNAWESDAGPVKELEYQMK